MTVHLEGGGQFPNHANVKQSKHQLQSGPPLDKKQHRYFKCTCIQHTNCQCACPVIWLKLQSRQIANYNECVITVIAFKMTIPECAVTLAHWIKPISVSVMFASQLVITQSHKQRASLSIGCVPYWTLKTLLWIKINVFLSTQADISVNLDWN